MFAPRLMPVIAARNSLSRAGSAYSISNSPGPPCLSSFWGMPVRSASVRLPQKGYSRWFAISRMPPDVRGLLPVEEEFGLGRVGVGVPRALEEPERGERVEKVPGRPRMEAEAPAEHLEFLRAVGEFGEHAHLDGAQEGLRRPERQSRLQNPFGGERLAHPFIVSRMTGFTPQFTRVDDAISPRVTRVPPGPQREWAAPARA